MSWLHLQTEQVPALHHTVSPWKLQGSEKLDCNDSPNVYEDNAFIYSSPEYTPWAWFSTCSHCPPVPVPQCLPTTNTTIVGFRSGLKRIYRIKKKKIHFKLRLKKINQCLWKYLDHFSWEELQQTKQEAVCLPEWGAWSCRMIAVEIMQGLWAAARLIKPWFNWGCNF